MTDDRGHVQVYSTRIPVAGWASLVLVAIAAAIAIAIPEARMIALAGVVGGAVLATVLILRRK